MNWKWQIPLVAAATFVLLLWAAGLSAGEVAASAPKSNDTQRVVPARSALDAEPIRHGADVNGGGSTVIPSGKSDLSRIAGALVFVIGLIFLLRWGGKKFFNSATAGRSTRAMQLLTRMTVAPGKHVLLLRVGRRIIVVGDGGSQMAPLSEITDADEIASLLGQLQDEKSKPSSRAFNAMFNRAKNTFGQDDVQDDEVDAAAQPAGHTELGDESILVGADESADAALAATRSEITGLMDKVRMLSRGLNSRST